MKIIRNNLIPFKGYKAINLFGVIFARRGKVIGDSTLNHEAIHTAQMRELLYVPFYLAYVAEWLVRLFLPGNAYRSISFEREARLHAAESDYLARRRHFAQWRND